jgi:cyclophilin family peptidyl-prolyl cis-trans isomerase
VIERNGRFVAGRFSPATITRVFTAITLSLGASAAACGAGRASTALPQGDDGGRAASAVEIPAPRAVSMEHEVTDRVEFKTSMGTFVVGLYGNDAPVTVRNFLSYVDRGFYSGKVFHRVIPGFMIQGGGFDAALERSETDDPIRLEVIPGLKHELGVISMARTDDPHSATSQFFVCVASAVQLNGGYAAFGKVEEGIDVVVDISSVMTQTATGPHGGEMGDVPITPVVIEYARRLGGAQEHASPDAGTP